MCIDELQDWRELRDLREQLSSARGEIAAAHEKLTQGRVNHCIPKELPQRIQFLLNWKDAKEEAAKHQQNRAQQAESRLRDLREKVGAVIDKELKQADGEWFGAIKMEVLRRCKEEILAAALETAEKKPLGGQ